ncbi:uncharacterized protein LOC127415254 [Myxocyprinus asiaticus]|uniref:uncharacterized protein LOC127415254 n=1 Tax=Myxocyprinus asiaticus TaxID=70543 RepID=UPI0022239DE3|nr:uncharacterized protein LOC127415254 [Myxocyprinus asiaticus]
MDKQLCVMILILYEVSECIYGSIVQSDPVLSVQEGDTVILSCFIPKQHVSMAMWYKQVIGEEPCAIASSLHYSSKSTFYNEFDNNHFDASRGTDSFNLTIIKTVQSDLATYYCAISFSNIITFGNGTHLVIKGAEMTKLTTLQPLMIEPTESEANVPLQCSIQKKILAGGDERLYWFKHDSGESYPGTIYIHGNTSDPCVRNSEADCLSRNCLYNLPKENFSPSDAGIYYCALATCGEVLFGNISKVTENNSKSQNIQLFILVALALVLIISFTINILICCKRRNGSKSQHIQATDDDDAFIRINLVACINKSILLILMMCQQFSNFAAFTNKLSGVKKKISI